MSLRERDRAEDVDGPPVRVGPYEIIAEIGSGGMGVVYLARDTRMEREVALKRPHGSIASTEQGLQRFARETRAASSLSHPNIVGVLDVFEQGGLPWLAMEYVAGPSLRVRIDSGRPLPVDEILSVAQGIASALELSHRKRILHRDINPKNIILAPDGRARLTDFGLAKTYVPPEDVSSASTESSGATDTGAVVGTLSYMAPEQLLGKGADPRTDIFAVGAVIYEMCTGRPAFGGNERGTVTDAILHREPEAVLRLNYEVPEELDRVVRKCLRKRPEERYQGASDLLADLRAIHRERESGIRPGVETRSSNRSLLWPLLVSAVLAAVAAAWLAWSFLASPGAADALPRGEPRRLSTSPAVESHPVVSPDGSLIAFVSDESGNEDIWLVDARGGDPLRLTSDPAAERDPAWFPDGSALAFVSHRGEGPDIRKVARLGGESFVVVQDAASPSISPDGRRIAFTRESPAGYVQIHVAPLEDPSRSRPLTGASDGLWYQRDPAWSPDGASIAYADARDLWIAPAGGGAARRLTSDGPEDFDPAWSSDGRFIYFSSYREGTLAIWRLGIEGVEPQRVTMGTGPESQPSVSRSGSRLAYSTILVNPDLILVDPGTGARTRLAGARQDFSPDVAPDESGIVFVSDRWGNYDLWIQLLEAGRPSGAPRRLTDHPGTVAYPDFSPDGRRIAYHRVLEGQRDIWVVEAAGGLPRRLTDSPAMDIHPAWSPDGSEVAFISDRDGASSIWLLPVTAGEPSGPPRRLTEDEGQALWPAWSPDGRYLAYVVVDDAGSEARIIPRDGSLPSRRVTEGAGARLVRWDPTTGDLGVSGTWGTSEIRLWMVSVRGDPPREPVPPVVFGPVSARGEFDFSKSGGLLVFEQEELVGDVWVFDAEAGSY